MSTSGLLADLIADGTTEYELTDEKIGSYSMGEVRGAIRKTDQMHVCIKVIKLNMTDKYNLQRVMREIELLSTIKHPKCIKLVGFNLYPQPIIITKFIPNGTLYKALQKRNKRTPGHEVFTLTKMMCSLYGLSSFTLNNASWTYTDVRIGGFGLSRKATKRRMTAKVGVA